MPPIPQSRIARLVEVVREIDRALSSGDYSADFRGLLSEASDGAVLINRALCELAELVRMGLRDEALSMYDPSILDLARSLDFPSRPDWIRVHGWMLEQGLASPPRVDLGVAGIMATAMDELAFLGSTLDRVRWTALARRPTKEKIVALRELRECDPEVPLWGETLREHERQRLRELQEQIPSLLERLDTSALAVIREELLDDRWETAIPVELLEATDGADIAARLGEANRRACILLAELQGIDERTGGRFDSWEELLRSAVHELSGIFSAAEAAIDELGIEAKTPARTLQSDLAMRILAARDAAQSLLDRILVFFADRDAHRLFGEQCRSAEYLCDNPPTQIGSDGRWLADLDRCELELNRLCQAVSGLEMSPLLQQRIWQSRQMVVADRERRSRFRTMAAVVTVLVALGGVALAGVMVSRRGQRSGVLDLLAKRVDEADRGWHTERPESVERFAGQLAADPEAVELIEKFDEGVLREQERRSRFEDLLEQHTKLLPDMESSIEQVESRKGPDRICPWPAVFHQGRAILDELASIRETMSDVTASANPPVKAREYLDRERERLERTRLRQVTHEARLESLATDAFKTERDRIIGDLATATEGQDHEGYKTLLRELERLQQKAAATSGPAGSGDRAASVIPQALIDTLEPIRKRLAAIMK